jgi:parallel beta-helix repeat protein
VRFNPIAAPVAACLALAGGTSLYWSAPALADQGPGPHGSPGGLVYVSNLKGGGTPGPTPVVSTALLGPNMGDGRGGPGPVNSQRPWGPPWRLGSQQGCATAAYTTIGAAVAAATTGQTIVVCPGVYHEMVTVPAGKALTIEGLGNPFIDAKGLDNGVQVLASGTTVEGLSVGYALGEGILVGGLPPAAAVSDVTVRDNYVFSNDQGNPTGQVVSNVAYSQCNGDPATKAPGDCGEGLHLLSATGSTVTGNVVIGNSGGILVTDEDGPSDGNTIAGNLVVDNTFDCGITLAGHVPGTPTTPVAPSTGGVYNNTVQGNVVLDNGVMGQGAGVLLAAGAPGASVYGNTVSGNTISGNGLAGVTLHSHASGQDMNGNVVRFNVIGANNLDGDPDFGGNTNPDVDAVTTGVIVAGSTSATNPVANAAPIAITIVGNRISDDVNGIWDTTNVTATTTSPANTFVDVTSPVVTAP